MDARQKIEAALAAIKGAQTLKALAAAQYDYHEACNPAAIRELLATHTAEIAAREAEIARLREALEWSEQFNRLPGEGYTECFERIGEVFYRKTGCLRPGKNASPESGVSMDERQAAWDAWIAEGIAKMRAALTQQPPKD